MYFIVILNSCQFCDLTLADSQGLKYHTRLHTGYGLSRCSVCGKGKTVETKILSFF